jgi:heat shock protein HtpX
LRQLLPFQGIGLIAMSIIAPMAAMIIQMAISRSREYLADATGASFAGNPEGLATALEKLGAYSKKLPMDANPSTAHMFIVNPLSGRSLMSLFSTHPPPGGANCAVARCTTACDWKSRAGRG